MDSSWIVGYYSKNFKFIFQNPALDKVSPKWTKDGSEWTQDTIEHKVIVNLQCKIQCFHVASAIKPSHRTPDIGIIL